MSEVPKFKHTQTKLQNQFAEGLPSGINFSDVLSHSRYSFTELNLHICPLPPPRILRPFVVKSLTTLYYFANDCHFLHSVSHFRNKLTSSSGMGTTRLKICILRTIIFFFFALDFFFSGNFFFAAEIGRNKLWKLRKSWEFQALILTVQSTATQSRSKTKPGAGFTKSNPE